MAVRPEPGLPASIAREVVPERFWGGDFETLGAETLPGEPAGIEQRLHGAGYRYVFPLAVRGSRIGLAVTSLRREGRPLDSEDVDIVRALLDQAALAIENAQLLDQVHRQLEHVVALQQHNQGILESTPAGIAVIDPDGRLVSANLAFAALAGRPRGEVLGLGLDQLLGDLELPAPGTGPSELTHLGADGEERHLEVSVAPFQGGAAGQRVVVLQDVSARVAMENALKDKDRLAALGVLAAGVAHEVNTPLTGISSYAQLLLAETDEGDPRHELLKKVERQTFRASRIVSGLLEFARKPGRERRPVDLAEVVAETAELLRERMSAKGVRFERVATEGGAVVLGSEGELQQVLTNLMLNAIDAMAPQGGGELVARVEVAGDRVRVAIEDSGPGIAAEHLATIFEPFFTTKRLQGGTGLGLSICCNIVEQHGGTHRRREPGGRRRPVHGRPAPRETGSGHAVNNILVVDDEEILQDVLGLLLRKEGHRPIVAKSGEEALMLYEKETIDLVLLDLMLPGMSGLEVLRQIRQRDPDQVVIIVTAYSSIEGAIEAMREGAFHYIPKPFKNEEVLLTVRKGLEQRRLRSENRVLKEELHKRYGLDNIIGKSQPMQQVFDLIRLAAPSKSNILILGESGTGKELVAKAIHHHSRRAQGPFVTVNSGSMPPDLLESTLFGHVKGAFTGAIASKKGLFEVANDGSIFFDEIGNIPLDTQAKLLRVIQERSSCGWAASTSSRSTCASSPRPTPTSRTSSSRAASARISTTG